MIISHTRKFIYIKAAKVAGSSLESMLWESCGSQDIRAHMDLKGFDERFEGQNLKNMRLGPHSEPTHIKQEVGQKVWNYYHKIVCIRNPWDTVVSLFWMRKGENKDVQLRFQEWLKDGCKRGFTDFIDWINVTIQNLPLYNNTRFYYWDDGSRTADSYLRFEHLKEDYIKLCHKLSIKPASMRHFKSRFRQDSGIHYSFYYDQNSVELVSSQCQLEQSEFGYNFEIANNINFIHELKN